MKTFVRAVLSFVLLTFSCQSIHASSPADPGNAGNHNNPDSTVSGDPTPNDFKTYRAASCSYKDVSDCINGTGANTCRQPGGHTGTHKAINGDTIKIPPGTCTWNSQLQVPVLVHLLGADPSNAIDRRGSAGGNVTVLIDNLSKADCSLNHAFIYFNNGPAGNGPLEIGNFTVQGLAADPHNCNEHLLVHTASHAVRIHDLTFQQMTADGLIINGDEWGVGDHNSFTDTGVSPTRHERGFVTHHDHWQERGDYGDNSWHQADTMGTEQAMYWENNVFDILDPNGVGNVSCEYGARCVIRYNDVEWMGTHGTDSNQRERSVRHLEIYNNNIRDHGQSITGATDQWRGGTGMYFNNTITPTVEGNYQQELELATYRRAGNQQPFGTSVGDQGGCWGNSPWDTNDGTIYFSGAAGSSSTTDNLVDRAKHFGIPDALVNHSVYNVTQGWGSNIKSSTSIALTTDGVSMGKAHTWNAGDRYEVLRATQCLDQPGVGAGPLYSNGANGDPIPELPADQVIDPVYAWGNQYCNPNCMLSATAVKAKFGGVMPNLHYYDQLGAVGNGTRGTGEGTLSQRPLTCTAKVGYWATDTNTLYQCENTDTWVPHYTPYTYPHPLTMSSQ